MADWTLISPTNRLVNGSFQADTTVALGWTLTNATVAISGAACQVTATSAAGGISQTLSNLEASHSYTIAVKVNGGANKRKARVYTTGAARNMDVSLVTSAGTVISDVIMTDASATNVVLNLTVVTNGQMVTFDDVAFYAGSQRFAWSGNDLDKWRHATDPTKIDGADLYAGSVPPAAVAASIAGDGLTSTAGVLAVGAGVGMAAIAADSIALGTPSTLTAATTNSVSGTTHAHAVTTTTIGAINSIVATDGSGWTRLAGLGIGVAPAAANQITMVDGGKIANATGDTLTFAAGQLQSSVGVLLGVTRKVQLIPDYAGGGALVAGGLLSSTTADGLNIIAASGAGTAGKQVVIAAYNGTNWYSMVETANVASGNPELTLCRSGGKVVLTGNAYTTTVTINDDAVVSFTPASSIGILLVNTRSASYPDIYGMANYRCDATSICLALIAGSAFAVTTGALAGTTGTDGKLTVSAHTDNKVYIENRRGFAVSITYTLMGS